MSGFNTPTKKDSANSEVKTPDTEATIMDTGSVHGSPTNEYYHGLETTNEQLRRENIRLKHELDYYRHKPGETPSTVLQINHNDTENEYYALDLVPYTTEHRRRNLPVRNAEGEPIGTVNMEGNLLDEINAEGIGEQPPNKRPRTGGKRGGKKCITRGKRGGNKKSCKQTKKR